MTTQLPPDSAGSVPAGTQTGTIGAEIPRERRLAALHLARYNLRYLVRLYGAFDGDLLLPIVLGEVGLYNMGGLAMEDPANLPGACPDEESFRRLPLRPCNAFSISSSTGIPRETVRRKVSHLIQHGYIDRDQKGGLTITSKAVSLCMKPFDEENQSDFLTTATRIQAIMSGSQSGQRAS